MTDAATRVIVPIAEVAVEAYRAVFGRFGLFLDLAWLPLIPKTGGQASDQSVLSIGCLQ